MMSETDQTRTASTVSSTSNSSVNTLQPKSVVRTVKIIKSETSGGTDSHYIPGHDGIFISHVRRADLDGIINVGDRIISVNGTSLETITHEEAVDLLKEFEGECVFKIEANAERSIALSFDTTPEGSTTTESITGPSHASTHNATLYPMPTENDENRYPSQMTEIVIFVVGAAALLLIAYLGYKRFKKST